MQSLAEQRRGGETGVRAVQGLSGEAVWKALDDRKVDTELFSAALKRAPKFESGQAIDRKDVRAPKLLIVHYNDGLRVSLFELNGAVSAWTAATIAANMIIGIIRGARILTGPHSFGRPRAK